MKNAINYFYNLIVDDIHQNHNLFYFTYNKERYSLILYEGSPEILNDIYNLHLYLLKNNFYVHQIILNKDNGIVTLINGLPYVLLKTKYYYGLVNYNMIVSFIQIKIPINVNFLNYKFLIKNDWKKLWANKNDYLEYQLNQLGQKYPMLRDSFGYYIGLGETAISLLNFVSFNSDNESKVVAHHRISVNDSIFDLYNPLNLIADNRVRDLAEYFKSSFFYGNDISREVDYLLSNYDLTVDEKILFFARMMYPTYYFDLFEDIISGNISENNIKKITMLTSDYEKLLKRLYVYYRKNYNIIPIEWLEKY